MTRPGGGLVRRAWSPLRVVAVPFVVARAIVLGALGVAHLVLSHTHPPNAGMALRVHQGLLAWDGGFYEAIARFGYRPYGHQALRFFPLFPLAGRGLADATGIGVGASLVVIANLAALVGTALVVVLVRRETEDAALARRSAWLLSPGAARLHLRVRLRRGAPARLRDRVLPRAAPGPGRPAGLGVGGPLRLRGRAHAAPRRPARASRGGRRPRHAGAGGTAPSGRGPSSRWRPRSSGS